MERGKKRLNLANRRDYILIGPYPPPLGGVSVYLYRLEKLNSKNGLRTKVIDFAKLNGVEKILFILAIILSPERATFHLNEINIYVIIAIILRPFSAKYIFTDHSGRAVSKLPGIKKELFRRYLGILNECVLVGDHLESFYVEAGLRLPENTRIQNAFLPPPVDEERKILATYDKALMRFIDLHSPIIVANAYRIVFYEDEDLYGIDLCVELMAFLKKKYPDIGMVFALAEIGNSSYYSKIIFQLSERDIAQNFFFLTGQKELWPIIKIADLFVRPTNTDGDSVSIREALFFGTPVLASDVVNRPKEVSLFLNRNIDDFCIKAMDILSSSSK